MRAASSRTKRFDAPPVVRDALREPGKPLDNATRGFFESRFGHDFSQVRVHDDAAAARSAFAMSAKAFTAGRDLVFGSGRYAPETAAGRRLLAHELAHVAQQSHDAPVARSDDHYDREADHAADAALTGGAVHGFTPAAAAAIQRQPEKKEKKPEITLRRTRHVIPAEDVDKPLPKSPLSPGPLPLLPPRSPAAKAKPEAGKESPVETSIQVSAAERKVTTNFEVLLPIKPKKVGTILGKPLILNKDPKFEVAVGGPRTLPAGPQPEVALKASTKAFWLDFEPQIKNLELGAGLTVEGSVDPAEPLQPEAAATLSAEASYRLGRTPMYLEGKVGSSVTFKPSGHVEVAPVLDLVFKVKF